MTYATLAVGVLGLFFAVLFNWVKANEKERSEVTKVTLKVFLLVLGVGVIVFSITEVQAFYISPEPLTRKEIANMVLNTINGFTVFLCSAYGIGYWTGATLGKNSEKTSS